MCGIFGIVSIWGLDGLSCERLTNRLFRALNHRGPDGKGVFYFSRELDAASMPFPDNLFLMGHTRLAIIDLTSAGAQPMATRDGRYHMVYNGEIYNYIELRKELESLGRSFDSDSDSEVLLQSYAQWGRDCLDRLNGMFSLVIADLQARTLFCARDRFGIKPFYYTADENGFRFASELPALLQFPDVERDLSPQRVFNYLAHGSIESFDTTLFQSVKQLPPAHSLEICLDSGRASTIQAFWSIDLERRSTLSFSEAAEQLRNLFLDSVHLHLRSDAPLGIALSGGIDSSAVACCVRHLEPEREFHSFSYVADDPALSEVKWIDIANQRARTINHATEASSEALLKDLPLLIERLGEPFNGTSIYAQHRVFQLARQHGVTVVLEGQGADELLGGYDGFCMQRTVGLIRQKRYVKAARFLYQASQWPDRCLSHLAKRSAKELLGRTNRSGAKPRMFDKHRLSDLGIETAPPSKGHYTHKDFVRSTLANFITWENLPNLLRHGDRNAMTFSIENRVPFLTRDLAEFLFSLPEEYLIDGQGRSKAVFREAMRCIVPNAILDRKDKVGFATPEQTWLKQIREDIRKKIVNTDLGMIERSAALELVDTDRGDSDPILLWRTLNYLYWLETFNLQAC